MKNIIVFLLLVLSLHAEMFTEGSKSVGIKLGSSSIGTQSYVIAGVSGSYFVIDNLSVGFAYEGWFSGNPDINKLTLESTYYIEAGDTIHPYSGLIIRRILINGEDRFGRSFDDTNSYGARAGVAIIQDKLLLSLGVVYEKYDTTQGLFTDSETYLEAVIGFTF